MAETAADGNPPSTGRRSRLILRLVLLLSAAGALAGLGLFAFAAS